MILNTFELKVYIKKGKKNKGLSLAGDASAKNKVVAAINAKLSKETAAWNDVFLGVVDYSGTDSDMPKCDCVNMRMLVVTEAWNELVEENVQNIMVDVIFSKLKAKRISFEGKKEIIPAMVLDMLVDIALPAGQSFLRTVRIPSPGSIPFKFSEDLILEKNPFSLSMLLSEADKMKADDKFKRIITAICEKDYTPSVYVITAEEYKKAYNIERLIVCASHVAGCGSLRIDRYRDFCEDITEDVLKGFLSMADGCTVSIDTVVPDSEHDGDEEDDATIDAIGNVLATCAGKTNIMLTTIAGVGNFADKLTEKLNGIANVVRIGDNVAERAEEIVNDGNGMEKLMALVGVNSVKEVVKEIVATAKVSKLRQDKGLAVGKQRFNMVFTGNPGTAKSTVASLMAQILYEQGVIKKNKLIVASRADLVAKFVGGTAANVKEKFKQARGGVLFIDEAYSLCSGDNSHDFGIEAINEIVMRLECEEDVLVIFAGYRQNMEVFIKENVGLASRIQYYIDFPDYNLDELVEIMVSMMAEQGYTLSSEAVKKGREAISIGMQKDKNFGNARFVRNLVGKAITKQASRILKENDLDSLDECTLNTIKDDDIVLGVPNKKIETIRKIGFVLEEAS